MLQASNINTNDTTTTTNNNDNNKFYFSPYYYINDIDHTNDNHELVS